MRAIPTTSTAGQSGSEADRVLRRAGYATDLLGHSTCWKGADVPTRIAGLSWDTNTGRV